MGRPKKEITRKTNLSVHCTAAEALTIKAKAKQCRLSHSEYLRNLGLGKKIEAKLSKEEIAIYNSLIKLANNVNQIAKRGNQTGMIDVQDLEDLMKVRLLVMKLL